MIDTDARALVRTLRDVLLEARAYTVAVAETWPREIPKSLRAESAEVLERIDGAIAEADEVLS